MVAGRGAGMSTGKQAVVALELAEIEELTRQALVRAGASEEHAGAVAHVVMLAEQVQRKLPKAYIMRARVIGNMQKDKGRRPNCPVVCRFPPSHSPAW
jgi:hypothetical protein